MGRKEPIMKQRRTFTNDFKRQVVEELLSGITKHAQIVRKYNISGGMLHYWKQLYAKGTFGNEPTQEASLKERIKELERMVGRLTMDNDFLKKALQASIEASQKKESLLPDAYPCEAQSKGGVKC